jgi:hypothetical protein
VAEVDNEGARARAAERIDPCRLRGHDGEAFRASVEGSQMQRKLRLAVVLTSLSALWGSNSAQADWLKLEPADAGFSVSFPAKPTAETKEKPTSVTRLWTVRAGHLVCIFGVTDYKGHIDAERELDGDMTNFLKSIEGTATSQQKLSFRDAPDGPLPALQFSFTRPGWTGRSLIVVSGDRSYQAAAFAEVGSDAKDLTRCIAFKVTVKSPHWQAP